MSKGERAKAMKARMALIFVGGVGKDAIVSAAINAVTVDNAAIGTVGSIPLPLPLTTTTIAAVNNHHCRFDTVNKDKCQKPAVVVCH